MDHDQALQTQASMRYALGELTEEERDSFEDHFADCSQCMKDVESSVALAANARAVFRDKPVAMAASRRFAWFPWHPMPALALSAAFNLLLLAGLGYELTRPRIPAPGGFAGAAEPQSVAIIAVRGTTRGSEDADQVVKTPPRPLVLTFDLTQTYTRYLYSIELHGNTVLSGEVSPSGQSDSLNLEIPADHLASGEYRVTLTGSTSSGSERIGACSLHIEPK